MKKFLTAIAATAMAGAFALPAFAADISFNVFTDEEADHIYFESGSQQSGDSRFHDGAAYIIYEFPISEGDKYAQIAWKIRNQYEVSVTNTDPDDDDAFEVVLAAQPTDEELENGTANWGDRGATEITVIDLSKWCEGNTKGKIWVKMADADPTNGWGGFIYGDTPVYFYSGTTPAPSIEQPKTPTEQAAELFKQYNFTANDQYFVVGTDYETPYIYQAGGNIDGNLNRFMDGDGYIIYAFNVKASDTTAKLSISINNQYDIRVSNTDPDDFGSYEEVAIAEQTVEEIDAGNPDWGNRVDENGVGPRLELDLSNFLTGKDGTIYVYVGDADTTNGWGGQILFNAPVVFTSYGAEGPATVTGNDNVSAPKTFDAFSTAAFAAAAALGAAVVLKKKKD